MKTKLIGVLLGILISAESFSATNIVLCGYILNSTWYPDYTMMSVALWEPEDEDNWTRGLHNTIFFPPAGVTIANNPIHTPPYILKVTPKNERAHWLQPTPLPPGFYSMESNFKLSRFVDGPQDGQLSTEFSSTDVCVGDEDILPVPGGGQ